MKRLALLILAILVCILIKAQSSLPATGGNVSGTGGSVSYSVGQVVYTTNTGINGTAAQGVQQPYEISVVTSVEEAKDITLEFIIYPNPATDFIKLVIKNFETDNLSFLLYNMNGSLLQKEKIESSETSINMGSYLSATYFLKIIQGLNEIKTFKIIKN